MFKKLMALILSVIMILPATGVFAAVTGDIASGMVVYTDNFEHLDITENTTIAAGTQYSSDVFTGQIHNGNMSQLVVGEGKDGSKAFKMTDGNTNYNTIYTIAPEKASSYFDNLLLTCDIKISYHTCATPEYVVLAGSNAYCNYPLFYVKYDAATGTNYIANSSGTKLGEYDENKWYKLVVRKRAQNGMTYAYLADEEGNLIAEASNSQTWGPIALICNRAPAGSGAELIIDNVELKHYIHTSVSPTIVTAPQIANRTDVPTSTNSTSFTVDDHLYLEGAPTATLTADGDTKTCTITRDNSKLYTYNVSWEGVLLEETDYTLTLSGMTYYLYGKGSTASYTFKTAEAPNPDVAFTSPASGATNVSADLKKMTVTFSKAITDFPETVTLTSANDTVTATVSTSDNYAFTFAWADELDGMATYSVNLEAFKNAEGLTSKTKTVSFTTENKEIVKLTDSFEDASKLSGGKYISDCLVSDYGQPAMTLVDGYTEGTKAMQFLANTWNGVMHSKEVYTLVNNEKLIATWRFRLDEMGPNAGQQLWIGANAGDYTATYDNTVTAITKNADGSAVIYTPKEAVANARPLYENRWYNITFVMGKDQWGISFVDDTTKEIVYKRTVACANLASGAYVKPFSTGQSGIKFTFDDFTLWKLDTDKSYHKLATEGNILNSNGNTTIIFNQPVLPDDDMFSLYYEDGEFVYKRPEVKYADFCKTEISYTGIDKLTDYTLDYSAVKGVSGADIGNKAEAVYEFTSEPAQSDVSVVGDVRCTGLTSGSTITANVYSNEARTVDIVTAFYEKTYPAKLQTVVLTGGVELSEGKNPVTINLNRDINAKIVKLFLWENGTLVPLMEEYKTLTPVDTLDILFIGSSLSEDSGRLFDQILKAAGHNTTDNRDINVTVKFVGGGSFVYHYNNLKREIDSNLEEAIKNNDTQTIKDYVDTQSGIMAGTIASSDTDKTRRLYTTFDNGVTQADGPEDYIMLSALLDKQYDFISIQPSAHAYNYNSMVNGTEEEDFVTYERELSYLTSTIRKYQPNAEIVLFQTWTHYYGSAPYGDQARRHKYFTNLIKPYVNKWAVATGENVENITDGGKAMTISPVGYAFYLADEFLPWAGNMYSLDSGSNSADAKGQDELTNKFNTSQGLLRDADHASYYGTFLADAVWYEMFTGNRASAGTVDAPAIARPTGEGPLFQNGAIVEGQTKTYFTITPEEHLARLEQLADIAHQAVKEYNTLKRMK